MQPFRAALCQVQARDIDGAALTGPEAALAEILAALDTAGEAGAQLVLLPECSYPAYYLRDNRPYERPNVRPFAEVQRLLAGKARQHGFWLAAGLAVPHADDEGSLTNSGLVFRPDGEVAGRYDKCFLWHFDTTWFRRGAAFPVFDAGFCRFGVLICADGRQPEVARSLAVNGAEVIADLTAWVSSGPSLAALSTPQCEYLMPVRAAENGAWVLAADKWGPEAGSIVYAGRSSVIDPRGQTRLCAPTDRSEVVIYNVVPEPPDGMPLRRPALYGRLTEALEMLPVARLLDEPLVPGQAEVRLAVLPAAPSSMDDLLRQYLALRDQDCDLVVAPGFAGPEGWEVTLGSLEAAVRDRGGAIAFAVSTSGCNLTQAAALVTPERTVVHLASHGRGIQLGESLPPVVPTAAGNVGLLCGDEGYLPEVARILALEGAEVLAWPQFAAPELGDRWARARSDENRVYTAAAWPGGGVITSPMGAPLAVVPSDCPVAMAAQGNRALARWKTMAPNTDAIRNRQPEAYGALTR